MNTVKKRYSVCFCVFEEQELLLCQTIKPYFGPAEQSSSVRVKGRRVKTIIGTKEGVQSRLRNDRLSSE